jgi:hypothetical protein
MRNFVLRILSDQNGATAIEYGLIRPDRHVDWDGRRFSPDHGRR